MTQYVIPTGPRLGRGLVNHDDASLDYRATSLLPTDLKPKTKTWRRGGPYDQGQTPWCVAETGKGILNTAPLSSEAPYRVRSRYSAEDLYHGAQRNDEWPGEAYDGTSGLGLCKYLVELELIKSYHWAMSMDDYLLTLSHVGPLGWGVRWKNTMWETDAEGFLRPGNGTDVGGHEVELIGVDMQRGLAIGDNSWGVGWGLRGRFLMALEDVDRLRSEDADAFVVTG